MNNLKPNYLRLFGGILLVLGVLFSVVAYKEDLLQNSNLAIPVSTAFLSGVGMLTVEIRTRLRDKSRRKKAKFWLTASVITFAGSFIGNYISIENHNAWLWVISFAICFSCAISIGRNYAILEYDKQE